MLTDPISDMLTRIKNGYRARLKEVEIPHSRVKFNLGQVLQQEAYLKDIKVTGDKTKKKIVATLHYDKNTPKLTDLKRVSKPGVRIYTNKNNIPKVLGGMGLVILSTPQGLLSGKEARKKGLGGEIICKVW
ncbi:30S ribosomal protein S8 [Candidatus Gottesmanbacteria bacterium RIFCSPHIGHO2_01_FULL_39_10]|uniref:Small ribosomal subunit protein uS8 n=1 Tax=Candidatus Gottesmanbacteria bacterium RIFCSPHIGHO2_01_FULL_39_10 TaxID=1798375 RepID=A0A1F5ZRW1_9BACT|nr:MAG: 30S ribosomal protein S8 [Candidatus Gottesmanbacteria bacterium RIFCSPHIGHO2_01_FULL_39_10]